MAATVTLIPGDGIGPEVSQATAQMLEAAGADISWEETQAKPIVGLRQEDAHADPLVSSLARTKVGLKGPITTPVGIGHRSINVALRRALDLFANSRPVKKLPGLYSGLDHTVVPGVVERLKIITERASSRIARFAFEYARKFERK